MPEATAEVAPLVLRPLQEKADLLVRRAISKHQRVVLVAPTGSGKRYLLVHWCMGALSKGKRVLFITDRRILVNQMAAECAKHSVPFGMIMGSEPRDDSALLQIASIQTLRRRKYKDMPDADFICHDEAHKEPKACQELFDLHPKAKIVGVTATPVGPKGTSLIGIYDTVVEGMVNSELLAGGWLLHTKCWTPSEPDIEGVTVSSSGEYNQSQLGKRVEECTVFADVFKHWEPYQNEQTILFSPKVKFAYGIAEQFNDRGVTAEVIEAGTSSQDRPPMFERFNNRETRVLVSVDVLREGFDAPIASVGIDLQPNKQFRTYWQKVGRVRRTYPGQTHATWLDFAGNFWRFWHPDEDPDWKEVTSTRNIQDVIDQVKGTQCRACGKGNVYKGQCQHCGERVGETKKPWSCSKCHYSLSQWEKMTNGKCPNCGHPVGKAIRRIKMQDGSLKAVSAEERGKKLKSKAKSDWVGCLFKAYHSDKSMNFARWIYEQDHGHWPSPEETGCPDPLSYMWRQSVAEACPWVARAANRKRRD